MPLENDFLPFATDSGAPVLTQAAYAGMTPSAGRGAGILPKEFYNKVARQSAVMAAAIGMFLNNNGQNALDDGDIPNLAAAFAAALGGANAPAFFSLRNSNNAAGSRNVTLVAGTYACMLQSFYGISDPGTYDYTATQSGIVAGASTLTVNTAVRAFRLGGSGYGRHTCVNGSATGTIVVATAGTYTMTLTGAVTGSGDYVGLGSILSCERVA